MSSVHMQRSRFSLPPLSTLRAFEAAARLGSFKAAAEDLGLTQSAISHQVHSLENHFRRKFFARVGNKLNLTQFGEAYSAVIVRAFAEMSRAGEELLGPAGRGIVQISVTPSFAAFGALPHLDRLRNIDSALDFKIEARNTRVDFDTESIDAAVQLGAPSGRGLTSHRVFRSTLVPLAHPRIRDVYPRMKDERDLAMIPLIELNHVPKLWERWFAQSRFVIELPKLTLSSDSLLAALQMAEAGVGAVLAPLPLVAPLVSSGRLSMLLPPRSPPKAPGFYLSYRTKDAGTAKIRSIRTWVKEIVQALDRQVAEMPFKDHDWNERTDPSRQSS